MRDAQHITDLRHINSKELKDLFIGIRVNTVKLEHETNPIIREKTCNKLSTLYRLVPLKEKRDRELKDELEEFHAECGYKRPMTSGEAEIASMLDKEFEHEKLQEVMYD